VICTYMYDLIRYVMCFLAWNLYSYIVHRLGHIAHPYNFIYKIHRYHHSRDYQNGSAKIPHWYNFLWYFGHPLGTLDVWVQQTLGALIVYYIDPVYAWPTLVIHYFYEILLADGVLDHNPDITGPITDVMAIGEYHLRHHYIPNSNYALYFTIFDRVFGTVATDKDVRKKNEMLKQLKLASLKATREAQEMKRE